VPASACMLYTAALMLWCAAQPTSAAAFAICNVLQAQGETEDPNERFIQGWDATRDYLLHSNFLHPLERRTPALYYRCRS